MNFENVFVYNIVNAIRGMRNPMSGAHLSDTRDSFNLPGQVIIGPKDYELAKRLIKAGEPHRKFLRQIFVNVDLLKVPSYFMHEFATYKIGTTLDCSSTMHRITSRDLTAEDFEKPETDFEAESLWQTIRGLNGVRHLYLKQKEDGNAADAEKSFRSLKRMLPHSYLYERMTWTANYEVLANIWYWRHNHRLPIWHQFCEEFIEKLPYSEFITGKFGEGTK